MKIVAGLVTYNPDLKNVIKSIDNLKNNVELIIIVDNNSSNIADIRKLKSKKVKLIENPSNYGIAKALNILLKEAYKSKSDFLLTLDQDSLLKNEMIKEMIKYTDINDVAIICPRVYDKNRNKQKKYKGDTQYLSRCITSGSLMNLKYCKKIGYFDENMFIDYVDFDYCKRIILSNYKILRVNNAIIEHEIGKRKEKYFLFIKVYPTYHNSKRVYYYARNIKYYCLKYKRNLSIKEKIWESIVLLWKFIGIILYEDKKKEKINSFFKGIKESKGMIKNEK